MTHRWGFDLSMTAVRLMRREAGHWHEIASESLADDDMDQRLRTLVEQVPEPRVVDIFLPRDQILYTDVKLSDPDNAIGEIEAEMEGRTPYSLAELEIDWELGADGVAHVAAIARQTLSEAEAFADQCGLRVSRFSSLPEDEDFPRQPDFGIGAAGDTQADDDAATEEIAETAFASTRTDEVLTEDVTPAPETEPEDADEPDDTTPVVRVEDSAPVMQVTKARDEPLDPGPPLPRENTAPRVRTDLSLPDGGGRAAASLTPPAPADPYARSERPPAERVRILGLGLAAVLTAGIGLIVWSILPQDIETGDAADVAIPEPVTQPEPTLSDVPPNALIEIVGRGADPEESVSPTLPTSDEAPLPRVADLDNLEATDVQSGTTPVRPADLEPKPGPLLILGEDLAALAIGPDASGLSFERPTPPVTRPGNVALPGAQNFAAEVAPPSGEAPEYVPPPAPQVAAIEPPIVSPADVPVPEEERVTEVPESEAEGPKFLAVDPEDAPSQSNPDEQAPTDVATPQPEVPTDDQATEIETALERTLNEEDAVEESVADIEQSLPTPTELAASLTAERAPPRPASISERALAAETELQRIRPAPRPQSAQRVAADERGSAPPSQLAVAETLAPRDRPGNMSAIVARALTLQRQQRVAALPTANTSAAVRAALQDEADSEASNPRNSPRLAIPSNANVARQATIEEAIRLNRLNLIGVYGLPSDRRALIRLPSGRYVKVKVGDQIDGGTIARITDEALQYRKGGRTFQLNMPQG